MRRNPGTGQASREPEIEKIILAFQGRGIQGLTIEELQAEGRSIFPGPSHQGPFQNPSEAAVLLHGFHVDRNDLSRFRIAPDEFGNPGIAVDNGQQGRGFALYRKIELPRDVIQTGNLIRAGLVLCHEKRDFEESVEKAIQNLSFLRSFENVVVEVRYEQPLPGSYVRLQVLHDAPFGFKVNFSLCPARGRRCDHGYKISERRDFIMPVPFLTTNRSR